MRLKIKVFVSRPPNPNESCKVWLTVPQHCGLAAATTLRVNGGGGMVAFNGKDELPITFEVLDPKSIESLQSVEKVAVGEYAAESNRLVNSYDLDVLFNINEKE